MRMRQILFVIFATICLFGCKESDQQQTEEIETLKQNMGTVKYVLSTLIAEASSELDDVHSLQQADKRIGIFSPSLVGGGYQFVQSNGLAFPISLEKLTKSPGGYEADFEIGNPYVSIFKDVSIDLAWGATIDTDPQNVTSISIDSLPSGAWTFFKVYLSPADDTSIQIIKLQVQIHKILLTYINNN